MKSNKKINFHILLQIILFVLLIVIDQITKVLAKQNLLNKSDIDVIKGIFSFHYLENHGAAFGIFQNRQWMFYILTTIVLLILIVIFILVAKGLKKYCQLDASSFKEKTYKDRLFLNYIFSVLAAGAVGNLIDRVANGYVIDFIYCYLIDFPIFNFADICVTLSAIVLVIFFIFIYKEDPNFIILKKKKEN